MRRIERWSWGMLRPGYWIAVNRWGRGRPDDLAGWSATFQGLRAGRVEAWLWPFADADVPPDSFKAELLELAEVHGYEVVLWMCVVGVTPWEMHIEAMSPEQVADLALFSQSSVG